MDTQYKDQPRGPTVAVSEGFAAWLGEVGASLAMTSASCGALFMIGRRGDASLWGQVRRFDNPHGLWASMDQLWLGTRSQIWSLRNILPEGGTFKETGADRLYCPRVGFITAAPPAREIGVDATGKAIFVNGAFSCLATPDAAASFRPVWRPRFISSLKAEDRCHLNGLAMEAGTVRFVTAFGCSDEPHGWTNSAPAGGILISVRENDIVADTLSMPHSPRIHAGKLWLLNSGTCEFGYVDLGESRFQPVAFCPGYARGLAFIKAYAVVGLSRPRAGDIAGGDPVRGVLDQQKIEPRSGLMVIDLTSGEPVHWLRFEHAIEEVSDLQVIAGVRQAAAMGFAGRDVDTVSLSVSSAA